MSDATGPTGVSATPRAFRRVLITGIGGSGGSYLAEHVVRHAPETEVHGLARWHSAAKDNLAAVAGRVTVHEADLTDFGSVVEALDRVRPDGVFHIAAHANVRASFVTPSAVLANNVLGTSHLFEAIRILKLDPWIQLCSTSEVYGQVEAKDVPIREEAPMRPASPYAVSKAAADLLARTYVASYSMKVVVTRMFSYLNPRRVDLFATSFARQVARVEAGLQDEVVHGNLDSVRTLLDVRDAMRAYWDALRLCDAGEAYNIGGVATMTVGELLDRLVERATRPIARRLDPRLLRPADVTLQIPDVSKFAAKTGWKPEISFDDSLAHLLDHWRKETRREAAALGAA